MSEPEAPIAGEAGPVVGTYGHHFAGGARAISLAPWERREGPVLARHPWADDVYLQGGRNGLVTGRAGSYRTAFVEAFSDQIGFVRGEGADLATAEDACWERAKRIYDCLGPHGHEYEPRGYRNGGGICRHCGRFGMKVFSPEELGLFCHVCNVATYHAIEGAFVFCEDHVPHREGSVTCGCRDCRATWSDPPGPAAPEPPTRS